MTDLFRGAFLSMETGRRVWGEQEANLKLEDGKVENRLCPFKGGVGRVTSNLTQSVIP